MERPPACTEVSFQINRLDAASFGATSQERVTNTAPRSIQTIASTRLDHGGTSRSVPAICDALVDGGVDNYLIAARPADRKIACNYPLDRSRVCLTQESRWLGRLVVGGQYWKILGQLVAAQHGRVVVHDHAIWLASNHAVAAYCRKHAVPRVVSPRGMLGKWALQNGGLKKRIAWQLYQYRDLQSAIAFHATSEQEADEIRELGFQQPIAVIPNGIDVPESLPAASRCESRRALFLSRIHPKKGLISLIRAWKSAQVDDSWQLMIAGPDEQGHRGEVEKEVRRLGLADQVIFSGPVDDAAKWQLYVDADLFVLPSHNENFGIVIAEAMAAGRPVVTSTGTPWRVLRDRDIGWWVEPSVDAIATAIKDATSRQPDELRAMGNASAKYVRSSFTWPSVALQMVQFYRWLLSNNNSIPGFVRIDN